MKKIEWENITEKVTWKARIDIDDGGFGILEVRYKKDMFAHMWANGTFYFTGAGYKVEYYNRRFYFRILKEK